MATSQIARTKAAVIVALDTDRVDIARNLVAGLNPHVDAFKVGLELLYNFGPEVCGYFYAAGAKRLFIDCKLNDTPLTMMRAVRAIMRQKPWMFTVHASAGLEAMMMAKQTANVIADTQGFARPLVVAATVLTSLDQAAMNATGVPGSIEDQVVLLAALSKEAGLDGVVASGHEAPAIRRHSGQDLLVVSPGICWADQPTEFQERRMAPGQAIAAGVDYLVAGRIVTEAFDPREAVWRIIDEVGNALVPFCPHPD